MMRFVPFYEEYLSVVVLPRLITVVAEKNPSSLAQFRKAFNDMYGLNISYDHFRSWVRDLGITVERRADIVLPQPAVGEVTGELDPSQGSPAPEVEYDFPAKGEDPRRGQKPPPPTEQDAEIARMLRGRGGINIPGF